MRWDSALHGCLCVCSSNSSTLYLSHLHFFVFAALHLSSGVLYSCSNCHWSDCSSLDAMEAVIGHPRHSDQCHCYYRDFRHPGPRQQAQPRPKGNWKREVGRGEAPKLVMAAQRLDNCLSRCLLTAQCPACILFFPSSSLTLPSAESVFRPHPISHLTSLTELLSLCFSCCHISPVKGHNGSKLTVKLPVLQLLLRSASVCQEMYLTACMFNF